MAPGMIPLACADVTAQHIAHCRSQKTTAVRGKERGKINNAYHWKAKTIGSTGKAAVLVKTCIVPPCTSASLSLCFSISKSETAESSATSLGLSCILTWSKISVKDNSHLTHTHTHIHQKRKKKKRRRGKREKGLEKPAVHSKEKCSITHKNSKFYYFQCKSLSFLLRKKKKGALKFLAVTFPYKPITGLAHL